MFLKEEHCGIDCGKLLKYLLPITDKTFWPKDVCLFGTSQSPLLTDLVPIPQSILCLINSFNGGGVSRPCQTFPWISIQNIIMTSWFSSTLKVTDQRKDACHNWSIIPWLWLQSKDKLLLIRARAPMARGP